MEENENPNENPKKIEVVDGDGELNISPVYGHLEVEKPKPKETREIFIPEVKVSPSTQVNNDEENLVEDDTNTEEDIENNHENNQDIDDYEDAQNNTSDENVEDYLNDILDDFIDIDTTNNENE